MHLPTAGRLQQLCLLAAASMHWPPAPTSKKEAKQLQNLGQDQTNENPSMEPHSLRAPFRESHGEMIRCRCTRAQVHQRAPRSNSATAPKALPASMQKAEASTWKQRAKHPPNLGKVQT